ncbi:hypothetical protein AVEN_41971-1 [Araneus ventricosus]|uniref:Uncharacterized protein n=1 Tax=Araneus ventricosus TaxID=182803 RepID=A0A4Y2DS73_ARAVE|nr:hypothetical protein AVEN_245766-1 [Araneus ventricosus]GBM19100.1 hypothetical protein AVEN_41971-1 [Araneus ventricosus]
MIPRDITACWGDYKQCRARITEQSFIDLERVESSLDFERVLIDIDRLWSANASESLFGVFPQGEMKVMKLSRSLYKGNTRLCYVSRHSGATIMHSTKP